jgi:hypothetical protein
MTEEEKELMIRLDLLMKERERLFKMEDRNRLEIQQLYNQLEQLDKNRNYGR